MGYFAIVWERLGLIDCNFLERVLFIGDNNIFLGDNVDDEFNSVNCCFLFTGFVLVISIDDFSILSLI